MRLEHFSGGAEFVCLAQIIEHGVQLLGSLLSRMFFIGPVAEFGCRLVAVIGGECQLKYRRLITLRCSESGFALGFIGRLWKLHVSIESVHFISFGQPLR